MLKAKPNITFPNLIIEFIRFLLHSKKGVNTFLFLLWIILNTLCFLTHKPIYAQGNPQLDSIYKEMLKSENFFIEDTSQSSPVSLMQMKLLTAPDSLHVLRFHALFRQQKEYFRKKDDEVKFAKIFAIEYWFLDNFRQFYSTKQTNQLLEESDELIAILKKNKLFDELASVFYDLGSTYFTINENKSLTYNLLSFNQSRDDFWTKAYSAYRIGIIYRRAGDYEKAIDFFKIAMGNPNLKTRANYTISFYYAHLNKCDSTLKYLRLVNDTTDFNSPFYWRAEAYNFICIGDYAKGLPILRKCIEYYETQPENSNTYHYLTYFYSDLYKIYKKQGQIKAAHETIEKIKKFIPKFSRDLLGYQGRKMAYEILEKYFIDIQDYKQGYIYKNNILAINDTLKALGELDAYETIVTQNSYETKMNEIENEWAQKELISNQKIHNQRLLGIIILVVLFGLTSFVFAQIRYNRILRKEKQRSDDLLLNILPQEVAEELKQTGSSEARQYDNVTVLFTDFVGFTLLSEKLSPKELVQEIHECYTAFDGIIQRYGLEKIKTIGDAYLAVCGLPIANAKHAENVVQAAIEIAKFIAERKLEKESFSIRIGVHSGSVVAGIVGVKKYAYDIWGDTVNTAARMEQNSESGKINISGSTFELIKDKFPCEYRGKIEAKNKGKIDMYFVNY